MIIRREHRRNFTQLANEVVDDKNLSFEGLGLLTYLLSRPDDWQVRVDQLRNRGSVGRDKMYRIIGELRYAGYLHYVQVYEDGKVSHTYYVVNEEPRSEDRINDVSLVPEKAEAEQKLLPEKLLPEKLLPEKLLPEKPQPYKELTGTKDSEKPKGERGRAYAQEQEALATTARKEAFDKVKALWPVGALDDVEAALAAWSAVPPDQWDIAANYVPQFLRERRDAGRTKAIGLKTYIAGATWTRREAEKSRIAATVEVKPWSRTLWAILWGKVQRGERVEKALAMLRQGARLKPADVPTAEQERLLPPEKVTSDRTAMWDAYCEKLGFALPQPTTGITFLPSGEPPIGRLRHNWKAYGLLHETIIHIGAKPWWWRLYARGAPIAELIREARTSKGSIRLEMGPLPSAAELNAMCSLRVGSPDFAAWAAWFRQYHDADIASWPDAMIWTPTLRPSAKVRQPAGAAA